MTRPEKYLLHVTLATGHVRRSPRDEVSDDIVAMLRPVLTRALHGERVPLSQIPGYSITGRAQGRCCIVTLHSDADDAVILTTAVAGRTRCGHVVWRMLHETHTPSATDPERPPQAPWCADRIEVGAVLHPDALEWTGDYSRCIAWTWLEMMEAARATD